MRGLMSLTSVRSFIVSLLIGFSVFPACNSPSDDNTSSGDDTVDPAVSETCHRYVTRAAECNLLGDGRFDSNLLEPTTAQVEEVCAWYYQFPPYGETDHDKLTCTLDCYAAASTCAEMERLVTASFDCEDSCRSVGGPCYSNEFACPSGTCLPGHWRCDGEDDCGDGADEAGCPNACTISECPTDELLLLGRTDMCYCRDQSDPDCGEVGDRLVAC